MVLASRSGLSSQLRQRLEAFSRVRFDPCRGKLFARCPGALPAERFLNPSRGHWAALGSRPGLRKDKVWLAAGRHRTRAPRGNPGDAILSLAAESTSFHDGVMRRIARVVVPGYPHRITQREEPSTAEVFLPADDRPAKVAPLPGMMKDWRRFLRQPAPDDRPSRLQHRERTGRPLGNQAFLTRLETTLNRILTLRQPGRKPEQASKQVRCLSGFP